MKAKVEYSLNNNIETIDLTDYGYDDNVKFEDLTEEQQNEIVDNLRAEKIIHVFVETIDE